MFRNGYPNQWRQGIVIALKKPNKLHTAKESYRPITLNNTLSKLMGKIINRRLQQYLESVRISKFLDRPIKPKLNINARIRIHIIETHKKKPRKSNKEN